MSKRKSEIITLDFTDKNINKAYDENEGKQ